MASVKDMERIAKVLGVNAQTIRRGLEQGVYPFGCAVKCEKSYSYQFFPEKVREYLGVRLNGKENERKD